VLPQEAARVVIDFHGLLGQALEEPIVSKLPDGSALEHRVANRWPARVPVQSWALNEGSK